MTSPIPQVSRAILSFGSTRVLSQLLMFAVMVVLAKVTDQASFGTVSFVLAMSTVLFTFADFGMSTTVQRYVTDLGERAIRPAFAVKLAFCGGVALVVVLLDECFGAFKGMGTWIGWIMLASAAQLAIMTENARKHFGRAGALQLLTTVSFCIGAVVLATAWDPVRGPLLARAVSFALVGVSLVKLLFVGPGPLRLPGFGAALRMGSTVTVNSMFTQVLMRSDLLLVTYLVGFESMGVYRAAYTLGTLPMLLQPLFHFPLMQVVADQLASNSREGVRELHRTLTITIVVLVTPMIIGGWILAEPLLTHMFGEEYAQGAWALRYLLIASSASVLITPIGAICYMDGRTREMAVRTAWASVVMVALAFGLIPHLGPTGAALAAMVSQSLWALGLFLHHRSRMGLLSLPARATRFWVAPWIAIGTAWALAPFTGTLLGLLASLVGIVLAYAGSLRVLGLVDGDSLKHLGLGRRADSQP
jgi:O-antigen/teichoic acid export membrane protein